MFFRIKKSKLFLLFLVISFVSITSVACVDTSSNSESEEIPEEILYIKSDEFSAKYLGHEVIEDFHYRDVLAVYFEFTNNSSQEDSFVSAFEHEAFQNGRRLHESLYDLDGIENDFSTRIRRGKSTNDIYILFNLYDKSDVEINLYLPSFANYKDSMILSLE